MIAPSLFADLRARGVRVSIAPTPPERDAPDLPGLRLRIHAPDGALCASLREAIARHRDELLAYVFNLEERAAVLEYEAGRTREDAERIARGGANADGLLYLRDLAENHPAVRYLLGCFEGKAELVLVQRGGFDYSDLSEVAA